MLTDATRQPNHPDKADYSGKRIVSAAPIVLAERWIEYSSYEYLVFEYVVLTLFSIIGVLIGLLLKVQKAQLQEFETRSTRLALAREQAAMLAAANERSRIAREMHDVVEIGRAHV